MSEVRINPTENERVAYINANGNDFKTFNMKENSIDELVQKEKTRKFNNELEKFEETMNEHKKELDKIQDELGYEPEKADIKPMFARILVKPFEQNPFQKIKVSGGIIVDAGGYNPHIQKNPNTGRYEEQDQFIITGCVMEVGPEVKYLKEGDVVYYRKDTAVPVPFLSWGMYSINENQIIAAVNVGLTDRFNNVK